MRSLSSGSFVLAGLWALSMALYGYVFRKIHIGHYAGRLPKWALVFFRVKPMSEHDAESRVRLEIVGTFLLGVSLIVVGILSGLT